MSNTHNNNSLNIPYEISDDAESVNESHNKSWRNRNNSSHVYLNNHKNTNILNDGTSNHNSGNHNSGNNNGGISTDVESEEFSSKKKETFFLKFLKIKRKHNF